MSNYTEPYTPYAEVETDQSGRHPVSVGHLVMGVAFVGLATIWLLFESDVVQTDSLRWFLPLPWLAAGVAGLLAVALTGRRTKTRGVYAAAPVHPEPYTEPEPGWGEPDPLTVERDARLDADIAAAEQDLDKQ